MEAANVECDVQPIATSDYPSRVRRPRNSTLCCDKFASHFSALPDWHEALKMCMS
jgi:dTDP-4-dehydrorhamnose reductase